MNSSSLFSGKYSSCVFELLTFDSDSSTGLAFIGKKIYEMTDCGVSNTSDTSTGFDSLRFISKELWNPSGVMFKHLDISIYSLDCSTEVVSTVIKKEFEIVDCDVKHSSVTSSRLDSSLVDRTVFNNFLINMLKHFS